MRVLSVFVVALAASSAMADPLRPSIADQIKIGKDAAAQVRKKEKVLPATDGRVKELRRLGKILVDLIPAKEKKEKPFEYTFDVVDSKEVNAFALPGGPIFFYTGLLDKLKTEDEVVGILGHEMTHIRNQHWASAYADNLKRKIGILALLTIIRANDSIADLAGAADTVFGSLPYSRKHESEADSVGYDLMVEAGYNPQGMADVFTLLAKQGSGGPEFLSTHPDSGNRVKAIEKRIKDSGVTFPPQRPRKLSASSFTWQKGWATMTGGG
ncbi:MAG: M48 family metalloprotease [Fimbriimonadaceae bacterium]|nr:M48 family metalloprotease [Fimbriimonadaceae bacterium]